MFYKENDQLKKEIANLNEKNINQADFWGRSPLQFAAFEGNVEAMQSLIEKGADLNFVYPGTYTMNFMRSTPLITAAEKGNLEAVKLLVEKNAKIQEKNFIGFTALMIAGVHHHPEVASYLMSKGATLSYDEAKEIAEMKKCDPQTAYQDGINIRGESMFGHGNYDHPKSYYRSQFCIWETMYPVNGGIWFGFTSNPKPGEIPEGYTTAYNQGWHAKGSELTAGLRALGNFASAMQAPVMNNGGNIGDAMKSVGKDKMMGRSPASFESTSVAAPVAGEIKVINCACPSWAPFYKGDQCLMKATSDSKKCEN